MSHENIFKLHDTLILTKNENEKLKTKIVELEAVISGYRESLTKYKETMIQTREANKVQGEKKKVYVKEYFQTVTKFKSRRCDICNADYKVGSFSNHLRSKLHQENLGLTSSDDDKVNTNKKEPVFGFEELCNKCEILI